MEKEDVALYDRQIRVWGMQAQIRIRTCSILIIGLSGSAVEVAKNIILAGIGKLTVIDNQPLQLNHLTANFLARRHSIGSNRAQASVEQMRALNPNVQVIVEDRDISTLDEKYFEEFQAVLVSDLDLQQQIGVNNICREKGIPFFLAESAGMYGFFFSDFVHHEYMVKLPNGEKEVKHQEGIQPWEVCCKITPTKFFKRRSRRRFGRLFQSFKALREGVENVEEMQGWKETGDHEVLNEVQQVYGTEFSATCSVIGGLISQEILKIVTRDAAILQNAVIFDGTAALVVKIQ